MRFNGTWLALRARMNSRSAIEYAARNGVQQQAVASQPKPARPQQVIVKSIKLQLTLINISHGF
jgi:hypothetical protein